MLLFPITLLIFNLLPRVLVHEYMCLNDITLPRAFSTSTYLSASAVIFQFRWCHLVIHTMDIVVLIHLILQTSFRLTEKLFQMMPSAGCLTDRRKFNVFNILYMHYPNYNHRRILIIRLDLVKWFSQTVKVRSWLNTLCYINHINLVNG